MIRRDTALKRLHSANPLPDEDYVDRDELSAFISLFEERRSQMTTIPTTKPSRSTIPPAPRRSRWRPVLVFGAALILILGVVGGAFLLGGGEAEDSVASTTTVPPTTAAPETTAPSVTTTTVVEEAAVPVAALEWTRATVGPEDPDPESRIYGDAGWVGFRHLEPTPAFAGAAVPMYSVDGITWEEVPDEEGLFDGDCVDELASGAGRYLALIRDCVGPPQTRLVTSTDGRNWTQVPLDGETAGVLGALAHGVPGFVSLSGDSYSDGNTEWGYHVAAMYSPDGIAWTPIPHEEAVFGSSGWIDVRDVVFGETGFVAIGAEDSSDGQDGVIWHSSDGSAWNRVPNEGDMFGGPAGPSTWIEMEAITHGNGVYVVVGIGPPSGIWASVDGLSWSIVPNEAGVLGNDEQIIGVFDVVYGDKGFLAIASNAAWTSTDGLGWTRVPPDEEIFRGAGFSMDSIIHGDGMYVIGGEESTPDGENPVIWIAH